jgi:hypothetical protein
METLQAVRSRLEQLIHARNRGPLEPEQLIEYEVLTGLEDALLAGAN